METVYDTLQDTFGETYETYLEQSPGMDITEAEKRASDELKRLIFLYSVVTLKI